MPPADEGNTLSQFFSLVHDPSFIRFELIQEAPSIFNAVGRTYTETWHSALLGWLLDSSSSHELGFFPLTRLILLLQTRDILSTYQRGINLGELLLRGDFSDTKAQPNERILDEASVPKVGRFDIYITGIHIESPAWEEIHILIEMKVEDKINIDQCNKYIAHINDKRKEKVLIIPVFVAPKSQLPDDKTAKDLFGDDTWIRIDFRTVASEIIEPCLHHPEISDFGKYTLSEYLKTLKYLRDGGEPMAVTKEEREIVNELFLQHETAIRALYQILSENDEEFEPLSNPEAAKGTIKVKIGANEFSALSVRELYQQVLKFLGDNKYLDKLILPFATGAKRYLLATSPQHPTGKEFVTPVEYKSGGDTYYMEANKSRDGAPRDLQKLLAVCGLTLEVG